MNLFEMDDFVFNSITEESDEEDEKVDHDTQEARDEEVMDEWDDHDCHLERSGEGHCDHPSHPRV